MVYPLPFHVVSDLAPEVHSQFPSYHIPLTTSLRAEGLVKIVEEEEPTKIEVTKDGKIVAKAAVTVDGTWQKRGHSSRVGVVFVIAVRTGQVLD